MNEMKKIRFIILCLLLVLVGGTSLFIGRISTNVWEAQERIIEMEKYAQNSRIEYIDQSVEIQENFIELIENTWESDQAYFAMLSERAIMSKFQETLEDFSTQAYNSMIVAIKDSEGIIYTGYVNPEYAFHYERIDWNEIDSSNELTIVGDLEAEVGESNRLYIAGTELTSSNRQMEVFVFFEEQIMLDSLIETLSIDTLKQTNQEIENVLAEVVVFMAGVVALSSVIALYLRKIYVDTQAGCPYFGNTLCHYTQMRKKIEEAKKDGRNNYGGY